MKNTNEKQERISNSRIVGRTALNIGKDLAFLVTAPLVGQLPEELKREIYRESQMNAESISGDLPQQHIGRYEVYRDSSLTKVSTNIAMGTSILLGSFGSGIVANCLTNDHGYAIGFAFAGALAGFLNCLPVIIGRDLGLDRKDRNGDLISDFHENHPGLPGKNLGTVAGYLASIPIWAGIGAYKISKSYLVQKYQDALSELKRDAWRQNE